MSRDVVCVCTFMIRKLSFGPPARTAETVEQHYVKIKNVVACFHGVNVYTQHDLKGKRFPLAGWVLLQRGMAWSRYIFGLSFSRVPI